jgi:glutamate synthase (NADPH/NADH) small chain
MSHIHPDTLRTQAEQALRQVQAKGGRLTPKERLAIPPQTMPEQDPAERRHNFSEVALGYAEAQARLEAMRCLQCKNKPCIEGCPVCIDIPAFIEAIARGDDRAAIDIIKRDSLLPAICGRVCPQETQYQEPCTLGKALKDLSKAVSIGRLERYVADWERTQGMQPPPVKPETGRKVAVVGSGPASLVVAADVRREGHAVTVLEAFHKPGGVMIYGIPEFRLPKAIVQVEIETLKAMGVELRMNFVVGRTRRLQDLLGADGYDAVFIGTGAGLPKFMGIPGEEFVGVYSANEYLTRVNLMKAYLREAGTPVLPSKHAVVVGGGNVAMDSARTALRLGAEHVTIVYRRTEVEMPARVEEVAHAKEEGIEFRLLQNPTRIFGDDSGRVIGVECLKYELGEPDESGRRRPVPIAGSEFRLAVDTVIVAVGNGSNPLLTSTAPDLKLSKWGNILVDEDGKTSMDRVYAGGDIVLGAATVILAMGQGRRAAASINRRLAAQA